MKNSGTTKLKETFQYISGIFIYIAILVVAIGLIVLFFKGATFLALNFLPLLISVSLIIFLLLLILGLPLSFVKNLRGVMAIIFLVCSYLFGVTGWLMGFILTYYYWGIFWVVIGLVFAGIGVMPMGIVASAFNNNWVNFWSLVFIIVLTYGVRIYAFKLSEKYDEYQQSKIRKFDNEIIDIEPGIAGISSISKPKNTHIKSHVYDFDTLVGMAIKLISKKDKASPALLQRELHIDYETSAKIMNKLEDMDMIGPADGARPRDVKIKS